MFSERKYAAQENLLLEMPFFQSLIRKILLEAVCDHYIIT